MDQPSSCPVTPGDSSIVRVPLLLLFAPRRCWSCKTWTRPPPRGGGALTLPGSYLPAVIGLAQSCKVATICYNKAEIDIVFFSYFFWGLGSNLYNVKLFSFVMGCGLKQRIFSTNINCFVNCGALGRYEHSVVW